MNRGRLAAAIVAFLAFPVAAQTTPPPIGVIPPPLTGYVGRYLDSGQTFELPSTPGRVMRARRVKIAADRGLVMMALSGSQFGVYNLGSFAGRVAAGPLSTGANGEKFLPPDIFRVVPESTAGWVTPPTPVQEQLIDFDADDRGFYYLAYSVWGFAIVDSTGALVIQLPSPPVNPLVVLTLRSGAAVLALVSNGAFATAVYDVTNPAAPVLLRTLPLGIHSYARLASGAIAVAAGSSDLKIYASGADLAAGNAPVQTISPQAGMAYEYVATDGAVLFAAQMATTAPPFVTVVSQLTPLGGSFAEMRYAPVPIVSSNLQYGSGYFILSGFGSGIRLGVFVYQRDVPVPTDLSPYFSNAYPTAPLIGPHSFVPYQFGGGTFLIAAAFGVGDVFTMAQATTIPALSTWALIALAAAIAAIAALRMR